MRLCEFPVHDPMFDLSTYLYQYELMDYYFIQLVMINIVKVFVVVVFFNFDAQITPYLTIRSHLKLDSMCFGMSPPFY